MQTVWKFEVPVADEVSVPLPTGAKLLSVAFQGNALCLWALVDPEKKVREPRYLRIAGTGHPIEDVDPLAFIGTAHHPHGLVFHVFERSAA